MRTSKNAPATLKAVCDVEYSPHGGFQLYDVYRAVGAIDKHGVDPAKVDYKDFHATPHYIPTTPELDGCLEVLEAANLDPCAFLDKALEFFSDYQILQRSPRLGWATWEKGKMWLHTYRVNGMIKALRQLTLPPNTPVCTALSHLLVTFLKLQTAQANSSSTSAV